MKKDDYEVRELSTNIKLDFALDHISEIISHLNLPRNIIASNDEIGYAWNELPREISRIPEELRDELIVRMCIATSVGLFDGAINYIWNATIIALRKKVLSFGLSLVAQTLNKKFEESDLSEMRDAELLEICYKLELLSEEGYYFLNQNRDIRNNFSVAHPNIARIDDRELINFISRCCKYGITEDYSLIGIDVSDFVSSVKTRKLTEEELSYWVDKLKITFSAQRQLLIPMLMGIYCDPTTNESSRLNCLRIASDLGDILDEKTKSIMIDRYNKYFISGEEDKVIAGRLWFERLGLLELLSTAEKHSLVKSACDNLVRIHNEFNNFYNEPPFASRLVEISNSIEIPESVQHEYVYAVVTCFVGNGYGVSNSAVPYYQQMIENFSPKEIQHLLKLIDTEKLFSNKIKNSINCRNRFRMALELIEHDSMNQAQQLLHSNLIKKFS